MDGQAYYESLVAQGYAPQEAVKYTQQHYPEFGQAPAAPQVAVMPAPQTMVSGTPAQQMYPAQVGTIVQPIVAPSTNTSKGMRITTGIFGILMSLILIF